MRQIIVPIIVVAAVLALAGCSDKRHAEQLARAEALLDTAPDSALAVLNAIPTDGMSDRNRALHALFRSIALDRTYVDLESDSIIGPAVSYFIDHETAPYSMLAWYYAGRVSENARAYGLAVSQLLQAEDRAVKAGNHRYLGLIYRSLADINVDIFHFAEALEYRHKALDAFTQGNLDIYIPSAKVDLLAGYANSAEIDSALSFGKSLLEDSSIICDAHMQSRVYGSLAASAFRGGDYHSAATFFRHTGQVAMRNRESDEWYLYTLALLRQGDIDSVISLSSGIPAKDLSYLELATLGNYKDAYAKLEISSLKRDSIIKSVETQDVTLATRQYDRTFREIQAMKSQQIIFTVATLLIVTLIIAAILITKLRTRLIRKRHDHEMTMELARNLADKLHIANSQLESLCHEYGMGRTPSNIVLKNFINELNIATIKKEPSDKTTERIYQKISAIINSYRPGGEAMLELEHFADQISNNAISRLRENSTPKITANDIALATYLILGFDTSMICYMMNLKPETVYNRKSRLRDKIEKINATDPAHSLSIPLI